jgi:peptidoglycan/xylan/chitin deacetylase (PgdA/CDA1 family)
LIYRVKIPAIFPFLFKKCLWKHSTKNREIYLTFDDGPTPEVTDFVLSELKKYKALATFFVIGNNVENCPEIFRKVLNEGHSVGNHTQNHVNGWKMTYENYYNEVEACERYYPFKLFRPPYGKLTWRKYNKLSETYKIVMWNILSGDFDTRITGEECYENVIKSITNGSIIVMHDSVKAFPRLKVLLPKLLNYLHEKNYECLSL